MIPGTTLVTGATGATGGETVELLLGRGDSVRALAHRQDERSKRLQEKGVEVVFGDFLDFDAMRAALKGTRRAYFCYPIRPGIVQATAQFAQAAKEAGVDGIVNMSQISARPDSPSHAAQDHWLSEQVFDWSGVATAHIRPTFFAEWLLYIAPMIRAGIIHGPWGTGKHAPITAQDQARVIVGILENPEAHRAKVYPLFGPVEYTYAEIAQVLGRVLGKEVGYEQVSFDTYWKMAGSRREKIPTEHSAMGMYGEFEQAQQRRDESFLAQHLRHVTVVDYQDGVFAGTNELVEKIGGKPPTTLEQFIQENREAFSRVD
jgi:uncharacterized protein YbjT (DUF2867 family)